MSTMNCTVYSSIVIFLLHLIGTTVCQYEDNRCTLPNHPSNGKWEVIDGDGQPGDKVDLSTIIRYTCNQDYKLSRTETDKVCKSNWNETGFPECRQRCPPLYSTTTRSLKCVDVDDRRVDCSEATHETTLSYECRPYYESPLLLDKTFKCRFGKWTSSAVCQPVCGLEIGDEYQLAYGAPSLNETKYPWVTALYQKIRGKFINVCGGSIISRKLVLTAAHCVRDEYGNTYSPKDFMIGVGKLYNGYQDPRDKLAEYYEIQKIIPHPAYNGDTRRYIADIAILVTKKLFKWSPVVQPVCIRDVNEIKLEEGIKGKVLGFGITNGGQASDVLRILEIPYKNQTQCVAELPDEFANKYNVEGKICAGIYQKNTSLCNGDSGNGLVFRNEIDNRYYVHGIVSLSPSLRGQCDIQQNSLFTKVAQYYKFVKDEMSKNFEELCLLPPKYPAHGKFYVENDEDKLPGDVVFTSSVLIIECNDGYTLTPNVPRLTCEDIEYMPKCVVPSDDDPDIPSLTSRIADDGTKVICSYASWSAYNDILPENFDANLCTHINYAFAGISENGDLRINDERLEINDGLYRNVTALKNKNQGLKVLLSVGGIRAMDEKVWINLATNPAKMNTFLATSGQIIRTNNFDGLNIDWKPKENHKNEYVAFIRKLRAEYDKEGWLLTASVAANFVCTGYDVHEMNKIFDWVILKTYDFYGHWSKYTGEHTALFPSTRENNWEKKHLNVDAVTKNWIAAGLSKKRLIVSVAFYGRTFKLKDVHQHEIRSPTIDAGPGDGILKYREICLGYKKWREVKNNEQKSVYKYSGDEWISYDSPQAIRIKGAYIKDQGFLGVNVWTVDSDDILGKCGQKQILLKNLHYGLTHPMNKRN